MKVVHRHIPGEVMYIKQSWSQMQEHNRARTVSGQLSKEADDEELGRIRGLTATPLLRSLFGAGASSSSDSALQDGFVQAPEQEDDNKSTVTDKDRIKAKRGACVHMGKIQQGIAVLRGALGSLKACRECKQIQPTVSPRAFHHGDMGCATHHGFTEVIGSFCKEHCDRPRFHLGLLSILTLAL